MKRVLVIGSGGAGKTTFARRLHEITDLPLFHLDRLYWRPDWTEPTRAEWKELVGELLEKDEWILDGHFGSTLEMRMAACDTAVWLDPPPPVCVYQALKRAVKYYNRTRPDMGEGCREKLDWDFLWWIWTFKRSKSGIRLKAAIEKFGDTKRIVRLGSKREIEKFFAGLGKPL